MSNAATLWDLLGVEPVARRTDPPTSWASAHSITPGRTEAAILALFAPGVGMTDDEIAHALAPMHGATVKTARSRITNAGLLVDSGTTRPSDRGRPMIVWVASDAGRAARVEECSEDGRGS